MNIKVHTPKSMKAGSGMSSMKQLLMSIIATTISIALTFGTAAIIDNNKKEKEKRQIVMMVMYDMYNSMKSVEKADSMIIQSMNVQRQLAEDPTLFDNLRYQMALHIPRVEYTETTERIFSTSIETINTVGNVLFTESVAEFYQERQTYKTMVSDPVFNEIEQNEPFTTLKGILFFDYSQYALISSSILNKMKDMYAQCQQMMKVTDKAIEAYQKERRLIDKSMSEDDETTDPIIYEILQLQRNIDEATAKLRLE